MKKYYIAACGAVLLILSSCHHHSTGHELPPLNVEITTAHSEEIFDRIEVASHIESLYDVVIQPRVNGFLTSIDYKQGLPIRRGDLIFTINQDEFTLNCLSAQADLQSAMVQEVLAHNNLQRAIPLARIDAISRSDLDQYKASHSAAQAAVKSATEELNNANLNLSYTEITSPIDGIIADTPATEGDYVGPSTRLSTLTTISYIDTIDVDIPIPTSLYFENTQNSASYSNNKLLSNITLTLANNQEYPYKGRYHYTRKNSPNETSTIVVVAKFPNPQRQLKQGMFARVSSNIGEAKNRIVVPQRCVSQTQGVNSVWVVRPDSCVEFREVKLGDKQGEDWVIEQGVNEGEDLLLTGQLKVRNGTKVAPIKSM